MRSIVALLLLLAFISLECAHGDDGGDTLRRLVAQVTSAEQDPAAHFVLGQHYRYSCPCRALPPDTDCPAFCGEEAFRLYARTRDLVLYLSSREVLSVSFDYAGMLNDLGLMLTERGRTDDAFAVYREAVALAPRHMPALANLANLEQVRVHQSPRNLAPALPHARLTHTHTCTSSAATSLAPAPSSSSPWRPTPPLPPCTTTLGSSCRCAIGPPGRSAYGPHPGAPTLSPIPPPPRLPAGAPGRL